MNAMVFFVLSPPWFLGIDAALEASFAVITFLVALLAFGMYKRTSHNWTRIFGFSFLLISISYMIQSIFNFLTISSLHEQICMAVRFNSIATFQALGLLTHIILMTLGLSMLLYTTLKDKRLRTLWLLLAVSFGAIFLSNNVVYMFYLMSTIYLAFISWHFILNYHRKRKTMTLLVAAAFVLLFIGSFHFVISVNHQLFYVVGHILELVAYLLILANILLLRR